MRRTLPPLDASARSAGTERTLNEGLGRWRRIGELPFSLAVVHAQRGQRAHALQWTETLQAPNPTDPQARQVVQGPRDKR